MAEKIIEVNVLEDWHQSKAKYALYVNRVRITPGIRDGLKKVARRSLTAAFFDENMKSKRKKSAKLVGTVIGKYHPHGDTSVYDAIKTLSNDFEVNYPLFDKKGNWGTASGDKQAAMRYTETKLSQFAIDCVIGDVALCKGVVDWEDNFSKDEKEPIYFAPKIAYLLINGSFGIGLGMSSNIPGHNLIEVANAQQACLRDPNTPVVLKPQHAMPVEIIDTNWKAICNKGKGKYIARAIIDIGEHPTYPNHPALIIRSLPDRVYMNSIEEKIKGFITNKKIVGIIDILDESTVKKGDVDKEIFCYYIILKKGTDPVYMKNLLYKMTDLQKTFNINFEVLNDLDPNKIDPVLMSYRDYINFSNEQMIMNKFRLYTFKIRELKTVIHKRDAFIKLLQSGKIDAVISTIRKYKGTNDNELMNIISNMVNCTPLQASYIINHPLKKLSEGHLMEYINKSQGASDAVKHYEAKVLNEELIKEDIYNELELIKQKYGKPNKTRYIKESEINGIPEGEFKFILTDNNFIKKVSLNDTNYGVKGNMIKNIVKVDNTKTVLLFDDQGKVFSLPVHKIPLGDKSTPPIDIKTVIKNATSNIVAILPGEVLEKISKLKAYHFITVTTTRNIKKLDISDFLTAKMSGLKYTTLQDGDKVTNISIVPDGMDVVVYSGSKALRMNISDVPHMKRLNIGQKAMDTKDIVEGLSVITPEVTHALIVTNNGRINKFNILGLPISSRAKAGSKVIKLAKGDYIRQIFGVTNSDKIRIITDQDKYDIDVAALKEGSSISSGDKIIKSSEHIIKVNLQR